MEFRLKDNIDPRILEDLGFIYNHNNYIWKYDTKHNCKITLENNKLSMPLVLYYLIKLDLVELI